MSMTYDPVLGAFRYSYNSPRSMPDLKLSFDLAPKASTEKTSATTSRPTPESIINDIKAIAKDHGANLGGIKTAVDTAENERKAKIKKALQGIADLAAIKGTKARRFRLDYWYRDEAHTTEGVVYPVKRDEDGDVIGHSVLIDDEGHSWFGARHETMEKFCEYLDKQNLTHVVTYFDN